MKDLARRLRQAHQVDGPLHHFVDLGEWVSAATFDEFHASLDAAGRSSRYPLPRSHILRHAREFHTRAGTLTRRVRDSLTRVEAGQRIAVTAHQPNFATYLKQFSLFPALTAAARRTRHAPLYIAIDFDSVRNERFGRVKLPDLGRATGFRYLTLPVDRHLHAPVACFDRPPTRASIATMRRTLMDSFVAESHVLKNIRGARAALDIDSLLTDIDCAGEAARSMSEFAMILLSRLVNLRAGLDTVFVSGAELWRAAGADTTVDLIADWGPLLDAQVRIAHEFEYGGDFGGFSWWWLTAGTLAPLWWVCDCRARVRLDFADGSRVSGGVCQHCHTTVIVWPNDIDEHIANLRLLPRISLWNHVKNMLDCIDYGFSYMSSGSHAFVYGLIGAELGISMLPQVFLDSRGYFDTPVERLFTARLAAGSPPGLAGAQELVAEGRASSTYYLATTDPVPFAQDLADAILGNTFDSALRLPTSKSASNRSGNR